MSYPPDSTVFRVVLCLPGQDLPRRPLATSLRRPGQNNLTFSLSIMLWLKTLCPKLVFAPTLPASLLGRGGGNMERDGGMPSEESALTAWSSVFVLCRLQQRGSVQFNSLCGGDPARAYSDRPVEEVRGPVAQDSECSGHRVGVRVEGSDRSEAAVRPVSLCRTDPLLTCSQP